MMLQQSAPARQNLEKLKENLIQYQKSKEGLRWEYFPGAVNK